MLQVLIESEAHRSAGRGRWAVASAFAHVAIISAAVLLTLRGAASSTGAEFPPSSAVVYVQPVAPRAHTADAARGVGAVVSQTAPRIPTITVPTIPTFDPVPVERIIAKDIIGSGALTSVASGSASPPTGGVYSERLVDRAVVARADNGSPDYPMQLRVAALEGNVAVRFVVDSAGRVEPSSIEILRTSHSLFGDAVSRWLARTRYVPADVDGRPVRQLVEQRVSFSLKR